MLICKTIFYILFRVSSELRVSSESTIRAHQFLRVLLDPGPSNDHHVLEDLQGGDPTTESSQSDVQQHRTQQRAPSSLVHPASSSSADVAAGRRRYR